MRAPISAAEIRRAEQIQCPQCGTTKTRCKVWAGGPGHRPGFHPARLVAVQVSDGAAAPAELPRDRQDLEPQAC